MSYKDYSTEDFVLDKNFRNWVLRKDAKSNDYWADWIAKNPGSLHKIKDAREIILKMGDIKHTISEEKVIKIWEDVSQHIEIAKTSKESEAKLISISPEAVIYSSEKELNSSQSTIFNSRWKLAAIIVIALGLSLLFIQRNIPEKLTEIEETLVIKSNPLGQKSTVYLNDGSEVVLNSGSTLKYNPDFGDHEREIFLEGEAYFKVAHDKMHPFVVRSGSIETTALGTEFNVRAYRNDDVSVALTKGKVSVVEKTQGQVKNDSIILNQGEGIKYKDNEVLTKFQFDEKEYISWVDGVLYFDEAGEREVIDKLENWYGVNIEIIDQSPKKWGYTGEFERKSLETVLQTMSFAMGFSYNIEGKNIHIKFNTNTYE